jgi:DNA-binding NtrC family response regulator
MVSEMKGGAPMKNSGKLLYVDSNGHKQHCVQAFLGPGIQIVPAFNGEDALDKFQKDILGIKLIFTEFYIGQMNGVQLINNIQTYVPAPPCLVIYEAPDPRECHTIVKDVGGLGLYQRPENYGDLSKIVSELLETGESRTLTDYHVRMGWERDLPQLPGKE